MKQYFQVIKQNQNPKRVREEEINETLTNEKKDETKGKMYRYNAEWKQDFPWLTLNEEQQLVFCCWCSEASEKITGDNPYLTGNSILKRDKTLFVQKC